MYAEETNFLKYSRSPCGCHFKEEWRLTAVYEYNSWDISLSFHWKKMEKAVNVTHWIIGEN